jgi:hypothetical protein
MVAWTMNYCQHYDKRGMPDRCKAGVLYASVGAISAVIPGYEARSDARPCINGHLIPDATSRCTKWLRKTREQGIAEYERHQEMRRRMSLVGPVVAVWRNKEHPLREDRYEVIECPACKGCLHLSQAAYNGHVHGRCESAGCVSWME